MIPLALLGLGIAEVYHSQIGSDYRGKDYATLRSLTHRTAYRLYFLALVPALLLCAGGWFLFPWIFDSQWTIAGAIVSLFTPWQWIQFVANPLSRVFTVVGEIHLKLIFDIISVSVIVGVPLLFSWLSFSFLTSLAWLGFIEVILYGLYLHLIFKAIDRAEARELRGNPG